MTKTIFVYFSYSGDNDKLASILHRELNCDTLKLIPEKEYTNSSLKILFQGGNESLRKKKPHLKDYTFKIEDYDYVIIGGPVWAWTFAPVLRSFLADNIIENKNIILTCTHRGSAGSTIENLKEELSGNKILLTSEIHAPIEDNASVTTLINDLKNILEINQ